MVDTVPAPWRVAVIEATVVLGVSAVIAIAVTWPLALHLSDTVHNTIDTPFQAWTIDHVQWALTGHGSLWNANIFFPNRHTLAYSDNLIGIAVPLLPLRWLGLNPIAMLNAALISGMAVSAASGYVFGRVVTGARTVGAMTGVAFAFGPFGTLSTVHLHATLHPGVALAPAAMFWLADRCETCRPVFWPVAMLVMSISWQLSVSFYPGAYSVIAAIVVLAIRRRSLGRRGLKLCVVALGCCAAFALVLAVPYIQVAREGRPFVQSADEVGRLGANFTKAESRLTVWGGLLGTQTPNGVPSFPGVGLLILSPVGAFAALRAGERRRRTAMIALVLVGVGALLGLGTAASGWRAYSPYRLLFEYVPMFKVLRAASRAWVLGVLGLGLLSGLGACAIGRRLSQRRPAFAAAIITVVGVVVVVGEGLAPWTDRPHYAVSAVDRALAVDRRPGGVLYVPGLLPGTPSELQSTFGQGENVYGTTAHHRATPNGYSGFIPSEFKLLSRRMQKLPDPATLLELRSLDVRFVVVRSWARDTVFGSLLDPVRARPLRFIGRYGGDALYEVSP